MARTVRIDEIDTKILHELVKDARMKLKDIASEVGLSVVATLKRIKRLKATGVIAETTIFKNTYLLGHPYPALLGVDLETDSKVIIDELNPLQGNIAGLSPSVGKYDLCIYVLATSVAELDSLRQRLMKNKGVKSVAVNIWTKDYFNFENLKIESTGE
jgi:DNA-binding Lrp family transcriptional regulator